MGAYACQLQRACVRIVLVDGAVAAIVRRYRRTANSLGRSSLELFKPGIDTLNILERTISTELVDVIEPAGAYVNSGGVGGPPGNVAFGRPNAGCAFTVQLPLAGHCSGLGDSAQPVLPPIAILRFDRDGQNAGVQSGHVVGDGIRRLCRRGQIGVVHGPGQADVRAYARQLQRACVRVVLEGAASATVVRRYRRAASSLGRSTLELFKPGLSALEILERAVISEVVNIVEPAGAYVNSGGVGGPPGNITFSRPNAGCTFAVQFPVTHQR